MVCTVATLPYLVFRTELEVTGCFRSPLRSWGRNILSPLERTVLNHWTRDPSTFLPEDGKRSVRRCVCSLLNTPRRTSFGNKSNSCCLDAIVLISFKIIFSVALCRLDTTTVHRNPLHFYWPVNQKKGRDTNQCCRPGQWFRKFVVAQLLHNSRSFPKKK